MASVNKVILIGNLGDDPNSRFMTNGDAVVNVTIATSESWKDKSTGEKRETTEWHKVVFYRKLAEIAGQYLKKGSSVYIEGSLKTRKWQDKEGVERYTTEIVANEMKMLGGKKDSEPRQAKPDAPVAGGAFEDFSDDIPFVSCSVSHDIQSRTDRRMSRYD